MGAVHGVADPEIALRRPRIVEPGVGRLLVGLTLLVVIGLDVLSGWVAVTRYRDERDSALAEVVSDADERAGFVDQLVLSGFDQLDALASSDQVRSGDPARIWTSLSRVDAPAAGFTGEIGWTDTAGDLRVTTGPGGGVVRVPLGDLDWTEAGLRGERFVGRAVLSRVLDQPVVPIAVPTRDDRGSVNGVLSGSVLLERTGRMLGAVAAGPDVLIADRAGQVIVDDQPSLDRMAPAEPAWPSTRYAVAGSSIGVTDPVGRTDRVVAWAPVPAAGWGLVVSRSHQDVLGIASRDLVGAAVVIALLTSMVLVGAVVLGRMLDRRYRDLHLAAVEADVERGRSAAMADAMARLGAAETSCQVAETVIGSGLPLFGARAAGMSLLDEDEPDHLVSIASAGWSDEVRRGWRRYAIDEALPIGDAMINAAPVFLTATELPARYPAAADAMLATGDAAWAALPLLDGTRAIGSLSASFASADALDAETRLRLGLFAERVSNAVTRVARQEADHELAVAFQRAVIPTHMPAIRGVQVEGHYMPASPAIGVGGDWYDAIRVSDHSLMVVCGDIVGHGLAAAAAASRIRVATATLAQTHRPAALLERIDVIVDRDDDARYSSMVCLLIDSTRRLIEYSVAGHPCPVMIRASGVPEELRLGRGHLLGVTRDARRTGWAAWDDDCRSVLLFTDGLVERRDELYDTGVQRLLAACATIQVKPRTAQELADVLVHDSRIDDDITAVLVHLDAAQLNARASAVADDVQPVRGSAER